MGFLVPGLRRTLLLTIEGLAVLAVVFALAIGLLTWRVASGPLDLNFARDSLTRMLEDPETDLTIKIGDAALYWPDLTGPLFIGIKNFELSNRQGKKIAEVGEAAIGLSRSRLLIGKIAPTSLILKKPSLKLIRREDNSFDFGFAHDGPEDDTKNPDILDKLLRFIAHPGDEEPDQSRFYRLRSLSIEDAALMVEDHVEGLTWFQQGLTLNVQDEGKGLTADLALVLDQVPVRVQGVFTSSGTGLQGQIKAEIPAPLPHNKIVALWPNSLKEDASYEWMGQKIKTALYTNVAASAAITIENGEKGWEFAASSVQAGFDFEAMEVEYRAPLHPLLGAKGTGRFDLMKDTLDIALEAGSIADIALSDTTVHFSDIIAEGKGSVRVQTKTKGTLKDYLAFAAREPIALSANLGFDPAKAKGSGDFDVMLDFPTRKDAKLKEFDIDIKGQITDLSIPALIGQADLTGGPLQVTANEETAIVEGKAILGGQEITLKRESFLRSQGRPYKSKLTASLSADNELRRTLGIDLGPYVQGPAMISIKQTEYTDDTAITDIKADLAGARIEIPELGYAKAPGESASASLTALLKNEQLTRVKDFTAEAQHFKIEPSTLDFKRVGAETILTKATIPRFFAGETVASLDMEREASGPIKLVLKGPFLDARAVIESDPKKPKATREAMIVSVAVDQMRTAEDQTVHHAKIYADIAPGGAFNQFEVDATAGKGAVYLRFKPDPSGKRIFHFEADDAGAALKAFGVYGNMVGGTISIMAEPMDGTEDRNMSGTALIENFKVVKAPALAQLIGALSFPGLLQLLGNDGLTFSRLEAGFEWLYDPDGSILTVQDGRTSGNSLGLTFDGAFDQGDDTMNIEGTIIPLSTMNKIVGSIPILGDLITGGTGSVFAATYAMKGETKNPDVMVNPLSVLTPGILRRILFEN